MGFFKIMYYIVAVTSVTFLILNHAPNLLDIEPQAYTPKLLKFDGALTFNKDLEKGELLFKDQVLGPESLDFYKGELYTSLLTGKIITINEEDETVKIVADTTDGNKVLSHPLGMRFYKDELYVVDAERGLLRVNIQTGKVTVLLSMSDPVGGKKMKLPNDLDVRDGIVYFSDVSTKWSLKSAGYAILEHDNSGRVVKYDISTGKAEVLLDGLYMPNGIQVTHDGKSLLVAELLKTRILRHHLSGSDKGKTEVFTEMPGETDNIRPSPRGGYWVVAPFSRESSSPSLLDCLANYPKIRKALAKLSHCVGNALEWIDQHISSPVLYSIAKELKTGGHIMALLNVGQTTVVELDADGKIVRSLHTSNSKFTRLSQGIEKDGYLYLGSFINPYMVKVKV